MARRHLVFFSSVVLGAGCAAWEAGCGSTYGAGPSAVDGPDAAEAGDAPIVTDGASPDALDARPTDVCDPGARFGAPVLLAPPSTVEGESFPRLTPDERTMVFHSTRLDAGVGGADLWIATRSEPRQAFAAATLFPGVNTTSTEADPMLSADELSLVFTSDRVGTVGNLDLWIATRPTKLGDFGVATHIDVSSIDDDEDPFLSAGDSELWFATGPADALTISKSLLDVSGRFTTAAVVASLGLAGSSSRAPTLSADGLTIYFASDRAPSAGTMDIWTARRAHTSDPFGTPIHVDELASEGVDLPGWLSPDGCRLYLMSSRADGGLGGNDIYMASR